jgi:hypothetical protein
MARQHVVSNEWKHCRVCAGALAHRLIRVISLVPGLIEDQLKIEIYIYLYWL